MRNELLIPYQLRTTEKKHCKSVGPSDGMDFGDPKSKQEHMRVAQANLVLIYYKVQREATLNAMSVFSLLEMSHVFCPFLKYIKISVGSLMVNYERQIEDQRRASH